MVERRVLIWVGRFKTDAIFCVHDRKSKLARFVEKSTIHHLLAHSKYGKHTDTNLSALSRVSDYLAEFKLGPNIKRINSSASQPDKSHSKSHMNCDQTVLSILTLLRNLDVNLGGNVLEYPVGGKRGIFVELFDPGSLFYAERFQLVKQLESNTSLNFAYRCRKEIATILTRLVSEGKFKSIGVCDETNNLKPPEDSAVSNIVNTSEITQNASVDLEKIQWSDYEIWSMMNDMTRNADSIAKGEWWEYEKGYEGGNSPHSIVDALNAIDWIERSVKLESILDLQDRSTVLVGDYAKAICSLSNTPTQTSSMSRHDFLETMIHANSSDWENDAPVDTFSITIDEELIDDLNWKKSESDYQVKINGVVSMFGSSSEVINVVIATSKDRVITYNFKVEVTEAVDVLDYFALINVGVGSTISCQLKTDSESAKVASSVVTSNSDLGEDSLQRLH